MFTFNFIRIYNRIRAGSPPARRLGQAALALVLCLSMIMSTVGPAFAGELVEGDAPPAAQDEGGEDAPPADEGEGEEEAPPPEESDAKDGGNEIQEDPPEDPQRQATMQIQVNESMGSVGCVYPIVAPGYYGLQPGLSLVYNTSGRNGFVGVGWSLGGLSAIQRASPGKGAPRYDANDIFLLGGQELVPCTALGGTHCFEISDSYARITRDEPNNKWYVWGKSGIKSTYTAVNITGKTDYRWVLSTVEDPRGHSVSYTYWCDGTNECYPDEISYNGVIVKFNSLLRTDPATYATGAGLAKTSYRLDKIDITVSGERQRAYQLTYRTTYGSTSQSVLYDVQQLGNGLSWPATSLEYSSFSTGFNGIADPLARIHSYTDQLRTQLTGDFNGDNKSDLYLFYESQDTDRLHLSNGDGTFTSYSNRIPEGSTDSDAQLPGDFNGDGKTDLYLYWGSTGENRLNQSNGDGTFTTDYDPITREYIDGASPVAADFNGDGKTDLFFHWGSGGENRLYQSNGNGTFTTDYDPITRGWIDDGASPVAADFNGDGKTDLFFHWGSGGSRLYLNDGDGTFTAYVDPVSRHYTDNYPGMQVGDFNGDGKSDLFFYWYASGINFLCLSNGDGTFTQIIDPLPHRDDSSVKVGDFNGDGKSDLYYYSSHDEVNYLSLSDGDGTFTSYTNPIPQAEISPHLKKWSGGDFNGDGLTDLFFYWRTGVNRIYLSNGNGTFSLYVDPIAPADIAEGSSGPIRLRVGDFDGDGQDDTFFFWYFSGGNRLLLKASSLPGLLTSVSNGKGGTTNIEYTPSVAWSNGYMPFVVPTVSLVTVKDGLGNNMVTRYSYQGGLYDVGDKEFRGFSEVTATVVDAERDSLLPVTAFRLSDYPIFGYGGQDIDSSSYEFLDNGYTLHMWGNTWKAINIPTTIAADSVLVFEFKSGTSASEFNAVGVDTRYTGGPARPERHFQLYGRDTWSDSIQDYRDYTGSEWKYYAIPIGSYLPGSYTYMTFINDADSSPVGDVYFRNVHITNDPPDPPDPPVMGPDIASAVTTFLQDDVYKGLVASSESWDLGDDSLLSKVENTYAHTNVSSGVVARRLANTVSSLYDGQPMPKQSKVEYTYDDYGNVLRVYDHGDLGVAGDELYGYVEYINDTTSWILGVPRHSYTRASDDATVLMEGWSYYSNSYDGAVDYGSSVKYPRKTETAAVFGSRGHADNPTVEITYDQWGNVVSSKNALGQTLLTTKYDSTYHMFPIASTNALGQTSYTYYYGVNAGGDSSFTGAGLFGQLKSFKDINGKFARSKYDEFGRIVATWGETFSEAYPATSYEYVFWTDASHPNKVVTHAREQEGQAKTFATFNYSDGLGRGVQGQSPSEEAGVMMISGPVDYDGRGLARNRYIGYETTSDGSYIPNPSKLKPTTFTYDASGRVVRSDYPDGTFTQAFYNQYETTTVDANGRQARSTVDIRGQVVKEQAFTGSYPDAVLYATTSFEYDQLGRLIKTTDNVGNQTVLTYDNLGRKIAMDDPDMGVWSYAYDKLGRMTSQTDAKGQTVTFDYDILGRLVKKTYLDGSSVQYDFDTFGGYTGGNSLGRLVRVSKSGVSTIAAVNTKDTSRIYLPLILGSSSDRAAYLDDYGEVVFSDDFSDGDYTGDPAWYTSQGWTVTDGYLKLTSRFVGQDIRSDEISISSADEVVIEYDTVVYSTFAYYNLIYLRDSAGNVIIGGGILYDNYNRRGGALYIYDGSAGHYLTGQSIATGAWKHVKITFGNGDITVDYDNGAVTFTKPSAYSMLEDIETVQLGGWYHSSGAKYDNIVVTTANNGPSNGPSTVFYYDDLGRQVKTEKTIDPCSACANYGEQCAPRYSSSLYYEAHGISVASSGLDDSPRDRYVYVDGVLRHTTGRSWAVTRLDGNWNWVETRQYDCYGSSAAATAMKDYLASLPHGAKVIINTYDEPRNNVYNNDDLIAELVAVGATESVIRGLEFRSSYLLIGEKRVVYTSETAYDDMGRLTVATYPEGSHVYYTYNAYNGAVAKVGATPGGGEYLSSLEHDEYGLLESKTFGNGVTVNYTYDPDNFRLTNVLAAKGASTVQNIDYFYDNVGMVTGIIDHTNMNWTYEYDDLYRLTRAKHGSGTTLGTYNLYDKSYAYDTVDNITSFEGHSYAYNDADHVHAVTSDGRGNTYTYDANGNMLSGAGRTFTWDYRNKPTTIVKDGTAVEFTYGPEGERVKKAWGNNYKVYVGPGYERDQAGNEVVYLTAGGARIKKKADGSLFFFLSDHLGGMNVILDASGNKVSLQHYYPYGGDDHVGSFENEVDAHKFTGQEEDVETGLYYYNARYYDPALGRFVSADPLVGGNRYAYCANNPVNAIDPSGYSGVWYSGGGRVAGRWGFLSGGMTFNRHGQATGSSIGVGVWGLGARVTSDQDSLEFRIAFRDYLIYKRDLLDAIDAIVAPFRRFRENLDRGLIPTSDNAIPNDDTSTSVGPDTSTSVDSGIKPSTLTSERMFVWIQTVGSQTRIETHAGWAGLTNGGIFSKEEYDKLVATYGAPPGYEEPEGSSGHPEMIGPPEGMVWPGSEENRDNIAKKYASVTGVTTIEGEHWTIEEVRDNPGLWDVFDEDHYYSMGRLWLDGDGNWSVLTSGVGNCEDFLAFLGLE